MSTNAYVKLKSLLPDPPVIVGKVIAQDAANDTSTIQLPLGIGTENYAPGVSVGQTIVARGRLVAIGSNAFVRAGVVESKAPDGDPVEAEIGVVAAQPFGPPRLALGDAIVAPAVAHGTPYSLDISGAWTGGYSPRVYTLVSGSLPAGLTLGAGVISGTPTAAGASSGIVIACEDSTHRKFSQASFTITVT